MSELFKSMRTFMAPDDGKSGAGSNTDPGKGGQDDKNQHQADDGKNQETIESLKAKLSQQEEAIQSFKEQKTKWEKREREEAKAKEDALKEQGKFEELYEAGIKELDTIKPRLASLETLVKGIYEVEVKNLPESLKKLLNQNDPVEVQLSMISKFKDAGLLSQSQKKGDDSPPGKGKSPSKWEDFYKK